MSIWAQPVAAWKGESDSAAFLLLLVDSLQPLPLIYVEVLHPPIDHIWGSSLAIVTEGFKVSAHFKHQKKVDQLRPLE